MNCDISQLIDSLAAPQPTSIIAKLRFRRDAQTVHRFGARVVYELLGEIGRKTGETNLVRQIVALYSSRLTLEILAAAGADRFQARATHGFWPMTGERDLRRCEAAR